MRGGLLTLLGELGIRVVGEARNGLEAIALVKVHAPDLALLDVVMPLLGGLEVVPEIRRWSPTTRIVLLTGLDSGIATSRLTEAPVQGVFLKSDPVELLSRAIPQILTNGRVVSPNIAPVSTSSPIDALTQREQQILGHLLRGYSNRAIAERLNVSVHTINNHRANLMSKIGVHSIAELMAYAAEHGLLELHRGPGDHA